MIMDICTNATRKHSFQHHITCALLNYSVSKKFPPLNSLQLCQIATDFQNFCTAGKRIKFAIKLHDITHLTLGVLLHYLEKVKIKILCRYSAIIPDIEENVNNLHIKCTDFNSSTRVTVYAECIYVF